LLAAPGASGYAFRVDPLRIMVIDEHAEMALPVIDALAQRGHRCDLQPAGRPALAALAAKRESGRPYQVIVANAALPDLDAIAFLSKLGETQERPPVVLYAVMARLSRAVFEAASAHDARFLDLPIDRARLVMLVEGVACEPKPGPRAATSDQPFFGTGRITRATPASERYQPQSLPSGSTPRLAPPMPPSIEPLSPRTHRTPLPQTGNIVRQGTDRFANTGHIPTTQHLRRGVTGRIERSAPSTPAETRVACAVCRREFLVVARPQTYNMVCVHCGQLNRIEPRPS